MLGHCYLMTTVPPTPISWFMQERIFCVTQHTVPVDTHHSMSFYSLNYPLMRRMFMYVSV